MAFASLSSCSLELTRLQTRRNKDRAISKNLVFEKLFDCTKDAVRAGTIGE